MAPSTSGRARARLAVIAGLAALAVATTALAADVRGKLTIPSDFGHAPAAPAQGQYEWKVWNGVLDPLPDRVDPRRAFAPVLIGDAPGPGPDSTFALQGGDLLPSTMVARAGSTLRIDNTDLCSHELYSPHLPGLTPLQTAPNNGRTLKLTKVGHYVIEDRLYPHVHGDLHVITKLVARGTVASDGSFSFHDVPPGTYTLKVFYGARAIASRPGVEVTENRDVTLDPIGIHAGQ